MDIEKSIVDFGVSFIQTVFFFLNGSQQSLLVSSIHYFITILLIYYFFKSKSRSLQRILFIIVLLFALYYFIFNRCLFTSIELKLSAEKNIIQKTSDKYFGENTEGNVISKISLSILVIIGGTVLLKDLKY